MSAKIRRLCVLGAIPMVVLWIAGIWAFAGFFPPPSPQKSPEALAEMFAANRNAIRIGLLMVAFGATLLAPFFGVVTVQMKRIEGPSSPLAYAQLALGALLVIEFILPLYFLQAAAFRPDRSPDTLQTYSDVAWLLFVGLVSTGVLQFILIGITILSDRRRDPILPRWFGYLTVWAALLFAPGAFVVFFQDGPLAWRGIIGFWLPALAFGTWLMAAVIVLLRVIGRQEQEETASAGGSPVASDDAGDFDARRQYELLSAEVSALRAKLAGRASSTPG